MTCKLTLLPEVLREWEKLAPAIKSQLKKKRVERLETPHAPAARLCGYDNACTIRLRAAGYRLA
ncbi:hypothetical protein QCD60_12730 [Pokkaliibacter sp. MBI-7]|uniref:type II toxin-antitoxin system RelE family toxin n=1 Tax=Pokkaliibacter sp. MBI-7 TaxID=3040600 RepID=UPI0024469033|nr:hypothetical protein [Pokkaliibacter sp. MBI-7]MDH2433438.1 hypothetical protein [Pokkaliibacter sp. MBI-7]